MAELLLELLSEEIPARMQGRAAAELRRLVTEKLAAAGLTFDRARAFATPRRLALVVDGLPERQPDVTEERRGPRVDAPEMALEGFLKGNGVTRDQCEKRETPKGTFWFAVVHNEGRPTQEVVKSILLETIVTEISWPKSMRWGENRFRWVRPIQGLLGVFDGKELEGAILLGRSGEPSTSGGIRSHRSMVSTADDPSGMQENCFFFRNITRGHRFLAPEPFAVTGFEDYLTRLEEAYVVLDAADRRTIIAERAKALAAEEKLVLRDDPALLEEVAGLVEWPCVLLGDIDSAFMDVPEEVLVSSMRTHQKYFALEDRTGRLAPRFLVVANMDAEPGTELYDNIVAGNERVLRARLSDAKFFWDQDRKRPLASRVAALEEMVFHARLGTLEQKVTRIAALGAELAPFVPGADIDEVRSAATLAKADLTTGMVGEFPELQGVMGRYYALEEGEKPSVAEAIAEHYSPLGPNDACPTAPVSVAVALADKLDTLVGFFAIGEKPTGSRDPFALRRAALGVIRLIIENGLRLPLREAFRKAYWGYDEAVPDFHKALADDHEPEALERELMDFVADRLKVHLRERGVRHDLINAVFALGDEDDLVRLLARVDALRDFLASEDGENLLVAYRRAANIVRIEEKRDGKEFRDVMRELFSEEQEDVLWRNLHAVQDGQRNALEHEQFTTVMQGFSQLRVPIDAFFDHVTVNAEDQARRANRLALLRSILAVVNGVADFSKIEG